MCEHKAYTVKTRPFRGPAEGTPRPNRAAHGWATELRTCKHCGAVRTVNVNGRHREYGAWRVAP